MTGRLIHYSTLTDRQFLESFCDYWRRYGTVTVDEVLSEPFTVWEVSVFAN